MLTQVYPSLKLDLINKLTSNMSVVVAFVSAQIAMIFLTGIAEINIADAEKLSFLIALQAHMVAGMVFEPARAASFTLAVGMVEDPKYLLERLSWLRPHYPSFS